jgi:diaminopimelate epimerase
MDKINFCKFHGFGNDYIVVEKDELTQISDIGEFTKKICHRNTGVGGDGIALLEKLDGTEADYSCRIINPDGSEAGFSGNGTRCAVAYLYYKNLWTDEKLKLKTKSGIKNYEFLEREASKFWYLAELGKPHSITNYELRITNYEASTITLDVGNPVCVVFVKIQDQENVEIRIWERGAGETSSSGTCSIAAAVAAAFTGKTIRKVSVHAEGGTTEAVWREDDEMLITGSADLAFCGEWIHTV